MRCLRFLFILLIFLISFLSLKSASFAQDKFQSDVTITYATEETGITHSTTNIIITNTTPNFYVTTYTIKLGFEDIENVKAYDTGGPIIPVIRKTDTGQEITLKLNSTTYGVNTKIPFTLSFDTDNIATKNGSIWEVNIPGLASQNEFSHFTVVVQVPSSFGKPTYIKPIQGNSSLTFTKDQLGKSGISLAFGNQQTYAFHLTYHLENTALFPHATTIALPSSTNYQDVYVTSLSPKPANVHKDTDGNWLAEYILSPSEKLVVHADGVVAVNLYPKQAFLSESDKALYTQEKQYWEQNPTIKTLAKQMQTPEAIYTYVVTHLSYNFSRVNTSQKRLGASAVLTSPNAAVCLEFTDLFVALARAAGIPAREIDGFAYTQNTKERPLSLMQDVLHAWPEYYDDQKKEWIMVDPTWGNTTGGVDYFHTFDFDHIAFSIKGMSSTTPIPAGGYKLAGDEKNKDIAISFSPIPEDITPRLQVGLSIADTFASLFPISAQLTLKNIGVSLVPSQKAVVSSLGLTPHTQTITVPDIPPFGTVLVTIPFHQAPFLTNTQSVITIALAGQEFSKKVAIIPFTMPELILGGIILAICCFTIYIIAAKTRRLSIL